MGKRIGTVVSLSAVIISSVYTIGIYTALPAQAFLGLNIRSTKAQEINHIDESMQSSSMIIPDDSIAQTAVLEPSNKRFTADSAKKASNSNSIVVWATAYSSDVAQTDSTPFITASGSLTHQGVAAANFLPFGKKFKIPALFGDKVFTVEDRMNTRYNNSKTIDIWVPSTEDAYEFGRRLVTIEVI